MQSVEDTDESGMTGRLLGVMVVLSATGVHRALLREFLNHGDGDPAGVARVDETLARLVGLSLLVWGESGTSVIMHRLVARIMRERQQAAGRLAATVLAVVEALTSLQIPEDQA